MKHVGVRSDPKDIASQEQLGAYTPTVLSGVQGQTTFGVPDGYVPDRIFVFINGVFCTEFTATDGATLTLSSGLDSDQDEVVVVPMGFGPGTNIVNYVGATQPVYTTAASISQPLPVCAVGDLLLATVMHRAALTVPTGWVQVAQQVVTGGGFSQYTTVLSKEALAADSSGTVTFTQAANSRIAATVAAFRGTLSTPSVSLSATSSDTTTNIGSPTPGAPITVAGNARKMLVVAQSAILVATNLAVSYSQPSGFNAQTVSSADANANQTRMSVGYKTTTAEAFSGSFNLSPASASPSYTASVSLVLE